MICLSDEQQHILDLVRAGKNIFFTGSAGTGKSVLLREIINHFGGKFTNKLAITASTGIAGVNIGGTTLHSFAGIGLGTESAETLIKKILSNKNSEKRWHRTQTLIIDEISMIDGNLFDKLEHIARRVREDDRPFGGIQLVLSGDFCQLPPVPERRNGLLVPILFAFEASSWNRCFNNGQGPSVYRLTKVFRQRDQAFVDMLASIRNGKLDETTAARFNMLSRPLYYSDGLEPCELFPLREQVHEANQMRLHRIKGIPRPYRAKDTEGYDIYSQPISVLQAKRLLDRLMAPESLELKVGAQVMLIKNLVQGDLVNGSLGRVIDFQSLDDAWGCNTEVAEFEQSKGSRLEMHAITDTDNMWPVVQFTNGKRLLLTPVKFEVVNTSGIVEACREQVPLILAWALSIHKSQGQTLERVKVDLGRAFENGQAYVALSRATSMDGLQVLNFHPSKVTAHPRVLVWQEQVNQDHAKYTAQTSPAFNLCDESNDLLRDREKKTDRPMAVVERYNDFDSQEARNQYWGTILKHQKATRVSIR